MCTACFEIIFKLKQSLLKTDNREIQILKRERLRERDFSNTI